MQTNSTIPYLQTAMPQQTEYRPASDKSSGKDDSFSKTLGKELSQGKQPVDNKPTTEKPADTQEAVTEPAESQIAAVIPVVIQAPCTEQLLPGQQPLQNAEQVTAPVMVEQDGVAAEQELMPQIKAAEVNPMEEVSPAVLHQSAETMKMDTQKEEKTTVPEINAKPVFETAKAQTSEVKPVVQEQSGQTQTEATELNVADMSKAVRQDMAGRQMAFEAPAVSQEPTVDMSEVKAGIQKLSQTMADQMAKGRTEFEIWLEPANLGKMAIKVAYESGRAMVSIMCTNEKAMEMISQNARNLGNILEQHTGDNTVVVVEHPESDYLQQQAQEENQGSYEEQEQKSDKQDNESDEAQSFLQQLRLGLAE